MAIVLYQLHPHVLLLRELTGEKLDDVGPSVDEDDNYLRGLDPKDWKAQDHYAVLGLKSLRHLASSEDIKKAYRRKILDHHPDKRRGKGESVKDEKHDYFSCITIAYEILGNPSKRYAYDCVDPVVIDDSVPSAHDIKEKFYPTLKDFFSRKARWSRKQPVPDFGDPCTPIENVHRFYEFWEEYDTQREFSYLDEEDKEHGEDRETRKAIERQNRLDRLRRKTEELSNIRKIVYLAQENDPRILAANKAHREAKAAKRQIRMDEKRKRREAEEQKLKEIEEAAKMARAASEERHRLETERLRKERELQKSEAKRAKRLLRSLLADRFDNFKSIDLKISDSNGQYVQIMSDLDLLCQRLTNIQLNELNKNLEESKSCQEAGEIFLSQVNLIKQSFQAAINACIDNSNHTGGGGNSNKYSNGTGDSKWTDEVIQILIKAVNVLPAGTPKRWEAIAAYVNQHVNGISVTGKEVLKQAKALKSDDTELRKNVNSNAFESFVNKVKETDAVKNVVITNQIEAEAIRPWTVVEQKALEQGLKSYPAQNKQADGTDATYDRWQCIADVVGTRTRRECMLRCKELSQQIRAKKDALASVTKSKT